MIVFVNRISGGARICSYVECAILICTAELFNSDVLCTGLCKPVQSGRSVCAIGRAGNHQKWLSLPLLILATLCANWRFSNPMLVIPKMTKNADYGPNLAVFGPKILIFMGVSKSFGTNITENHLGNLSALFFGQALDQMAQKCPYLAKNAKMLCAWAG